MTDYLITDLGAIEPKALNDAGYVVGDSWPTKHAAEFAAGNAEDLGTLGGATSDAWAINDAGVVVGSSAIDGTTHAFVYADGEMVDLNPELRASYSVAHDVTNDGRIVGGAYHGVGNTPESSVHAFIYDQASKTLDDLGTLPGRTYSMAWAVNESGDVVGGSGTPYPNENYRPFLYHQGSMSQLMDAIGTAFDINENGQIVLGTWAGNFLWENGQTTELQFNGIPYAINNQGEIVGWAIGATPDVVGPSEFACRIVDGQVENLNEHVTGGGGGWDLAAAYDINDDGEIVGIGQHGGASHGFLLTPDTTPHIHLGSPKIAEMYAKILFGVTKDGGGLARVGGHPVPIDPWGPFWSRFSRSHPDAVTALAIAGAAAQLRDASARTAIQREALGVIARTTEAP